MKRWEILSWSFAAIGLIIIVIVFLQSKVFFQTENSTKKEATVDVNPYARISASGSPIPATNYEDLIVEQQDVGGQIFTLNFDHQTKNWQLDFVVDGQIRNLRYIAEEEMFLFFDIIDYIWDEVHPDRLHEEYKVLVDIDEILFSNQQLNTFNQYAIEEESQPCSSQKNVSCAVWSAENPSTKQTIIIYVNKQNRKIDQILTFNTKDYSQPAIIASYSYKPVEVVIPPINQIRYLISDN